MLLCLDSTSASVCGSGWPLVSGVKSNKTPDIRGKIASNSDGKAGATED